MLKRCGKVLGFHVGAVGICSCQITGEQTCLLGLLEGEKAKGLFHTLVVSP